MAISGGIEYVDLEGTVGFGLKIGRRPAVAAQASSNAKRASDLIDPSEGNRFPKMKPPLRCKAWAGTAPRPPGIQARHIAPPPGLIRGAVQRGVGSRAPLANPTCPTPSCP